MLTYGHRQEQTKCTLCRGVPVPLMKLKDASSYVCRNKITQSISMKFKIGHLKKQAVKMP